MFEGGTEDFSSESGVHDPFTSQEGQGLDYGSFPGTPLGGVQNYLMSPYAELWECR